jgi:hypothetical protein
MMLTYVGLDLGVDTSILTNSVAPKFHLRQRHAANFNGVASESCISHDADGGTSLRLDVIDIVRENDEVAV